MFATLDDLDGQVEIIVFKGAYESNESKIDVDQRVLVRGRVDHKDQGETKLVVQEITPFDPTPEEIANAPKQANGAGPSRRRAGHEPEPVLLRVDARLCGEHMIDELKAVLEHFPGEAEVQLEMETSTGARRLRFGTDYRVAPSHALQAELDDLLGPDALVA